MKPSVFKYLKSYSTQPVIVDRLITSAFVVVNELSAEKNKFLREYLVDTKSKAEYNYLLEFIEIIKKELTEFTIENLIELFEFVISPSDKIVNGAIYTPSNIRDYIVEQCLGQIKEFENFRICDPACGCSGFLYTAARAIKIRTKRTYAEIFAKNIFGLDIEDYSITRSKLLLTLFAMTEGEVTENFEFNLFHGNALDFDWSKHVADYSGFQVIVGNPPYVCSRNMDEATIKLLDKWSVTKSGHPDLYIPFFQIGFENLAHKGVLGLITVNTFIKSVNGRALRNYFAENKIDLKIINFGGEQVFKDKNTYTCICFLKKEEGDIFYKKTESITLHELTLESYFVYDYNDLNHHDGWNLVDTSDKNEFINKIESVGKPFKELFVTRNGIATLKNDVYKFTAVDEDDNFYYINKSGIEYPIEKVICRRIVNANKIKTEADLRAKEEQIIFPYTQEGNEVIIIAAREFKQAYPFAHQYLKSCKSELATRDKGKVENYEEWYAYGRRQSMDSYAYKLFFPHICERPTFVISRDRDLLFYNGIAVISESLDALKQLKSLLESDIFFDYIKNTTKDYSSGYISMSRNYIKNFGIPEITKEERAKLKLVNTNQNLFWKKIYAKSFTR